ncbi:hypothetical protein, partial [Pseudomonas aeruginosa]
SCSSTRSTNTAAAGRSLSPAAAVFVERVLEQDRRFAAT